MQITDVRVRKVAKEGKLKAVVSITIDDEFVVHDIKVIEGEKGLFIAMPSAVVKNSLVGSGSIINGTVENSVIFKKVFVGNNCVIKNSIILNDVYLGDNTYIENCIVESRDTIRANTRHVGENGVKVVVEKNERYAL